MKEFDYSQPLENWIDFWKQKTNKANKQEKKLEKGFFLDFLILTCRNSIS